MLKVFQLPIAPYWNWNNEADGSVANEGVYQSHHTGIEIHWGVCVWKIMNSYQSHHTGIEMPVWVECRHWHWSTNRTILELKYEPNGGSGKGLTLLPIAPYWNWNSDNRELPIWTVDPTNRTILELKFVWETNTLVHESTTNRTILELKLELRVWEQNDTDYQSHHTGIEILELLLMVLWLQMLPIAPYWNWN